MPALALGPRWVAGDEAEIASYFSLHYFIHPTHHVRSNVFKLLLFMYCSFLYLLVGYGPTDYWLVTSRVWFFENRHSKKVVIKANNWS